MERQPSAPPVRCFADFIQQNKDAISGRLKFSNVISGKFGSKSALIRIFYIRFDLESNF